MAAALSPGVIFKHSQSRRFLETHPEKIALESSRPENGLASLIEVVVVTIVVVDVDFFVVVVDVIRRKRQRSELNPCPAGLLLFCRKEKKITFQTFAAEWSFHFGNVSTCRCCCCCQCLWHLLVTIRKVGDVTVHDVAPNNFLKWLLMIQLYCNQF